MAVIDLNNVIRPKKVYNQKTLINNVDVNPYPTYVDLHLDLQASENIGLGLNAVETGDILVDSDIEAIKNSLRNIFTTKKGQKILNPDFGVSLDQYLFNPISIAHGRAMAGEILRGITKYEPRVNVSNINVLPDFDLNLYRIQIYYTLLDINKQNVINIIAQLGGQLSF
jgi:phage baseplate assembly protein W